MGYLHQYHTDCRCTHTECTDARGPPVSMEAVGGRSQSWGPGVSTSGPGRNHDASCQRRSQMVGPGNVSRHCTFAGNAATARFRYNGRIFGLDLCPDRPDYRGKTQSSTSGIPPSTNRRMQLLGSLTSRSYRLHSPLVGAAVSSVAIGALIAVPFQKANIFSRARYNPVATNSMTITSNLAWTSHLVRRAIFILVLPIAGAMYAVFSYGPPVPVAVPCLFAALVGFLSCLAISECNGIIMETWDCSDLEPGMTGRSKKPNNVEKRTNYSSFPRVTAGYAIVHTFGFIFAAGATGIGGIARRNLGQRAATGVVAAILFVLTLLLISVLIRFRHIQIIPDSRTAEMERWTEARRDSLRRRESAIAAARATGRTDLDAIPEEDVGWRPLVIGNPLDKNRRMNILELGSLTRWSEICRKNRLIDEGTHLNRQALEAARTELGHKGMEVYGDLQRGGAMVGDLVRKVSKRSLRSKRSNTSSDEERGQNHKTGNAGPVRAGFGHSHVSYPTELFTERECVMGQTVEEEGEESSSIDEPPQDAYVRSRSQDHKSHRTPKIQPYAGFEQQEVRGGMRYSPVDGHEADAGGRREHASHMATKIKETDPDGTRQRNAHGSHMKSKVKTADVELESFGQEGRPHMGNDDRRPANDRS